MLNLTALFRVVILFPSHTKYKWKELQRGKCQRIQDEWETRRAGTGSCQALPVKNEILLVLLALAYFLKCLFPWWKQIIGIWKTAIKDWIKRETTYFISDPKQCLNVQMTKTKLIPRFIKSVNNIITHIKLLHTIWHKSTQC